MAPSHTLLLLSRFSHVRLCATPETAAHQASPSPGFSRQEHWSGLPFPSTKYESEKGKWSCSVMSDSSRPHGLKPTRFLCPRDFPGKSTGVGCHCLLQDVYTSEWNRQFKKAVAISEAEFTALGSRVQTSTHWGKEALKARWVTTLKVVPKIGRGTSEEFQNSKHEIDRETVETVTRFIFGGLQNHCRWWPQPWN